MIYTIPFVIVSAYQDKWNETQNLSRHAQLYQDLHARRNEQERFNSIARELFHETEGKYNGAKERGFMIQPIDYEYVKQIVLKYGQDNYLYVENDNRAYLCSPELRSQDAIGIWREVSETYAKSSHSYTRDILTNRFFVAE